MKKMIGMIHLLSRAAQKADDPAAGVFRQCFVTKQVKKEKPASEIIAMLRNIKPDSGQMVMVDQQRGKRE